MTINWGGRDDLPVVGDWNHDAVDTIGVYRQGTWLLRDTNTPGGIDRTIGWGGSSDVPLVVNWTGRQAGIAARRVGQSFLRDIPAPGAVDRAFSWGAATVTS